MRVMIFNLVWLLCLPVWAQETDKQERLKVMLDSADDAFRKLGQEIQDYTCLLMKREFVNGRDRGWQYIQAKVRHENKATGTPFSVYLRFLKPKSVAGREVLYVQGGDLIARRGGEVTPGMTLRLNPHSPLAMQGNRYPITEIGVKNLARRLIEALKHEQIHAQGDLRISRGAKVNGRVCTYYCLTQPWRSSDSSRQIADVFVDDVLGIPIFYQSYVLHETKNNSPIVLERYAYTYIKINVGLTDFDFDYRNPAYHFDRECMQETSPSSQ